MKISKRPADHQINKDEYEAPVDERDVEAPDPGQGMTRASDDVMRGRKIVKVTRRGLGGGASGVAPLIAPPSGRFTGMNSFNQQGTAAAAGPSEQETPTKANPFANISFALSAPTPSKPAFSFGAPAPASTAATPSKPDFSFGAPASVVKPEAPSNGFSFGSNSNAANDTAPSFSFGNGSQRPNNSTGSKALFQSTESDPQPNVSVAPKATLPSFSSPPSSKEGVAQDKLEALNRELFQWVVNAWEAGHLVDDFSSALQSYDRKTEAIINSMEEEEDDEDDSDSPSSAVASGGMAATVPSPATPFKAPPKYNTPQFSFGSSAPAPAASFSFGNSSLANTSFSLGNSSSSAPPPAAFSFSFNSSAPTPAAASSTSKPSYLFGSIPPPSNTGAILNTNTNDDDDPTANPDDGKIEQVQQEQNTEEDVLFEFRAKLMKLMSKEDGWKKYGAGVCRLYRHKTTSKHRLVLRNVIGKVQFNVAVSPQMQFKKELKNGKKGALALVKFVAVEDATEGPKPIVLQVDSSNIDALYSALVGMKE